MADTREPPDGLPSNPVVQHGRSPDPAAAGPVQGARAAPPRRGPGPPPTSWPGPVLRRDRDPLPDGYASRFGRRARTKASPPPGPATTVQVSGPAREDGSRAVEPAADGWSPRGAPDDVLEIDPALDPALLPELEADLDPALTPDTATPLRGPEPSALQAVQRKLGKALVPGERVLVAQTRHPVVLAEPVLTSLLVLLGIAAVSPYLGAADIARNLLMTGWVVLALRALWAWLQWANDYFVVTDRRLIRLHGLFDVQRDMMPLTKVTDMAFERPFWGRPFGYGKFVLESAGQDQALRVISFVRDPDDVDAIISRQIFAKPPFQPPRRSGGGR